MELLVVIGIIAMLIALLLPALASARAQAKGIRCLSNIRTLGTALAVYASENRGHLPPNVTTPVPQFWTDRIIQYVPKPSPGSGAASVYVCPEDERSLESYAMNVWLGSKVDKSLLSPKPKGDYWPPGRDLSKVILLSESWSGSGNDATGYMVSPPIIGLYLGTAGQRFGALGGVGPINARRWGQVNCELAYKNHRKSKSSATGTQPYGRVSICFGDGHALLCSDQDLVNPVTGISTKLAAWSPLD